MDQDLIHHAQSAGVETSFEDSAGVTQQASETTLRLLLEMLSAEPEGEDVLVVRDGDAVDLATAPGRAAPILTTLCKRDHVLARSREPQLALPDDLPRGEYRLDMALKNGGTRTLTLLHTPSRCYQPGFALRGEQKWLLSVQLYSLGNARNQGHGDFTDLRQLLELVAEAGGGGIGVNPLHALAEDDPDDASPYAPSSRVFLNWLYIDVAQVPGADSDAQEGVPLRQTGDGLIDYIGIAAAREKALRLAYANFARAGATHRAAFDAFRQDMGEALRRYAAFCLLRRREGGSWRYWRRPWAQPTPADIADLARDEAEEIGFHEFVQWQAHAQLAACKAVAERRGMPIGLYLDVAVGVHPDGFDTWDDPAAFLEGATIGAPPDALNRAGQNWGLTGFHPASLRHSGYRPFRRMLGAAMRHAGAIRLDHVLGLNRLYVIPPGCDPMQGAYLRYPLEELLSVTALESQHHRCLVIGEDLGTVPEGLRTVLKSHGIWTYRVVMFERDADGFFPPAKYPPAALATFSTHDLPTFAGWRDSKDVELVRKLGLPLAEDPAQRKAAIAALLKAIGGDKELSFDAIVRFLKATPSRLVAFALEDLLGSTTQINMPGTYREYPNWRHRIQFEPEQVKRLLHRLQG